MTGIETANTSTQAALQSYVTSSLTAGTFAEWETPVATGGVDGYTNNCFPNSVNVKPLTVNYYDNYTAIPGLPALYSAPAGSSPMTRSLLTATLTNVLGSSNMLWTVSYYDNLARVIKSYAQHYLGGVYSLNNYDAVTNTYDFTNQVIASTRQHWNTASTTAPLATIANTYTYDHMGRKLQTHEQINSGTNVILSQLAYNEIGQLYQKKLHSEDNGSNYIETVSLSYNPRGWLTETHSPNFDEQLFYDTPSGVISGLTGQYNGNILEARYNSPSVVNKGFAYGYDGTNRLITSKYYNASTYSGLLDETISYDNMGNITQLVRGGTQTYSGTFAYTVFTGNQVNTVTNNGAAYRSYTYDANGNTATAGTFSYDYNMLNLPTDVKLSGTVFNTYTYDAGGQKLRKVSTASGNTDYIKGIQYKNGVIDFIETEEGRYELSGSPVYQYDLKDHLGNVRVMIQKNTASTATAEQENEYYAYGLAVTDFDNSTTNKYLYNNKELQDENSLDLYDYGARFYDPVIGRWSTVDPLAEISRRWSPYNYGEDNPIRNIDVDGMFTDDGSGGELISDPTEVANFYYGQTKQGTPVANNGGDKGGDDKGDDPEDPEETGEPPINLYKGVEGISSMFYQVALNQKYKTGDGKFYIYGHGDSQSIGYNPDDGESTFKIVYSPEKVNDLLASRSPEWKKAMAEGKKITAIFYECQVGATEVIGSDGKLQTRIPLAQLFSKRYPNVTVIAANGYVIFRQDNSGSAVVAIHAASGKGQWNTFRNGQIVNREDFTAGKEPSVVN